MRSLLLRENVKDLPKGSSKRKQLLTASGALLEIGDASKQVSESYPGHLLVPLAPRYS